MWEFEAKCCAPPTLWPQFPFLTLIWVRARPLGLDILLVSLWEKCGVCVWGGGLGNGSPVPSRVSSAGLVMSACRVWAGVFAALAREEGWGSVLPTPPHTPWQSEPCWVPPVPLEAHLGPWVDGWMDEQMDGQGRL